MLNGQRDSKRPSKPPPPENDFTVPSGRVNVRILIKPALFTVAISGCSFLSASIWNYERLRSHFTHKMDMFSENIGKSGAFRNQINNWWNSLTPGHKLAAGIIGTNLVVLLMWRVVPAATMSKLFVSSPFLKHNCWPMLLSSFSHHSAIHFLCNMCVLWSFAYPASMLMGPEQLFAFYISAGMVSGLGSYVVKVARCTATASLGASGAICGLIGYQCSVSPDSRLSILFIDQIFPHSFSAKTGLMALMAFDTLGILLRWRVLDHGCHLAGVLFGIFYATYGSTFWRKRESFIKWYHDVRGKP